MTGSPRADAWTQSIDFDEVCLGANGHELTLVFSDLHVSELPPNYTPWRPSA